MTNFDYILVVVVILVLIALLYIIRRINRSDDEFHAIFRAMYTEINPILNEMESLRVHSNDIYTTITNRMNLIEGTHSYITDVGLANYYNSLIIYNKLDLHIAKIWKDGTRWIELSNMDHETLRNRILELEPFIKKMRKKVK